MTRVTRRTSKNTATIWPFVSKGSYGQVEYGAPYTVTCTFEQGSSKQYRDATGQMFIPACTYWYEVPSQGKPSLSDFIALGDHTLTTNPDEVDAAEIVKNSILQDAAVLNDVADVLVLT